MKHKRIWISLLVGVLVCSVVGGVVWWRQRHPRPYCKVSPDGDHTIEYTMCTDKMEYQFGESIHVTFTIKNINDDVGRQDLNVREFGNGVEPAMDICDPWGHTCWSDERTLTEDDKHFVLKLGESRTLTWTWPTTDEHLEYINEQRSKSSPFVCHNMSIGGYYTWPPQRKSEPIFGINLTYNCQ